jgi:hypothetical protein
MVFIGTNQMGFTIALHVFSLFHPSNLLCVKEKWAGSVKEKNATNFIQMNTTDIQKL